MSSVVAAPVGLIPCPTIALVLGFALLFANGLTRATRWALVGIAAFYAAFGDFRLGVVLDIGLLFGAAALGRRPQYLRTAGPRVANLARTPTTETKNRWRGT